MGTFKRTRVEGAVELLKPCSRYSGPLPQRTAEVAGQTRNEAGRPRLTAEAQRRLFSWRPRRLDDLVSDRNGQANHARITALMSVTGRRDGRWPGAWMTNARTTAAPDQAGNHREWGTACQGSLSTIHRGQRLYQPQKLAASQPEGSSTVITCQPSILALLDGIGSVVEACRGAARHTRA